MLRSTLRLACLRILILTCHEAAGAGWGYGIGLTYCDFGSRTPRLNAMVDNGNPDVRARVRTQFCRGAMKRITERAFGDLFFAGSRRPPIFTQLSDSNGFGSPSGMC
jgi:hypothetical protein